MNKTFSAKMRWLSLLGAVAMLMTHANTLAFYPAASGPAAWVVEWASAWAVPAVAWFFFSAAYWFFRELAPQKLLPRLKRRFFSLVLPFFLWNLLVLAAECARGLLGGQGLPGLGTVLAAFSPLDPINGALWFVSRLIGYVLLSPLFYLLLRRRGVGLAVVAGSLIAALAVCPSYYSFLYWMPVFCAGGWLALHGGTSLETWLAHEGQGLPAWGGALVFVAAMALALPAVRWGGRAIYALRLLSPLAILLLTRYTQMPPVQGWLAEQLSFYMFCTHWYLDGLFAGKLTGLLPAAMPGAVLVSYLLVCGLTALGVVGSLLLLHRLCPRLCALLTGGR